MRTTLIAGAALSWVLVSLLALPARAQELPEGAGKETLVKVCTACHTLDLTMSKRQDREAWSELVLTMVDFGAQANAEERESIVTYLATNFGLTPPKVNVNKATARQLEVSLKITAKESEAIVQYREQQGAGAFKDWHDLLKVDGIDEKKIEAAKDRIVTEDAPTPPRSQ